MTPKMGLVGRYKCAGKQQGSDDSTASGPRGWQVDDGVSPTALRFSYVMSTTQQTLDQLQSRSDVDPARVHERYLWSSPEVCSECYSAIRTEHELVINNWGDVVTETDRGEDAVKGYDNVNGGGVYLPRTFCEDCGGRGGADPDTDSKLIATRRASKIADRLEERDIPLDRPALRRAVRKLKEDPRIEAYDKEIYERATKIGVRRALP